MINWFEHMCKHHPKEVIIILLVFGWLLPMIILIWSSIL